MSGQLQPTLQVSRTAAGPERCRDRVLTAPVLCRCLLMHTGALYLTSEPPLGACGRLHIYGLTTFLAAFLASLLSVTVRAASAPTRPADPPHPHVSRCRCWW